MTRMICPFCNEEIDDLVHIDDCEEAFIEFTRIRKLQRTISGVYGRSYENEKIHAEAKKKLDILKPYLLGSRKERIEARGIVLKETKNWEVETQDEHDKDKEVKE